VSAGSPIRLADVGKQYTKYDDAPTLLTAAARLARSRQSKLWAVRNLDLEVAQGECLGLIGRNGSGKSTTLQMLCGVTGPTEGVVSVRGRVAPLIAVGVGFHKELTGRENVYVNGTILGMTRREIDRRFEEIVGFAEIEKFIDTPVKFYSSGMFVRLGFAVAIQSEPEVLLVDEILAVGDLAFQMKCFDHMTAVRESGTTIVVVTHNLSAIRNMCERAILLEGGTKRFDGPVADAISRFHDILGESREPEELADPTAARFERGVVDVLSFEMVGEDGNASSHADAGDEVVFRLRLAVNEDVAMPFLNFMVKAATGATVYADNNRDTPGPALVAGQTADLEVRLRMNLPTGTYTANALVHRVDDDGRSVINIATIAQPALIYVAGRPMVRGVADLQAEFGGGAVTAGIDPPADSADAGAG